MSTPPTGMSNAFATFLNEAPEHASAWMATVRALNDASALDAKTEELIHLAVAAALSLESGIPFHVRLAKQAGATRAELISALLVALPLVGQRVTASLPIALQAFDGE